MKKEINKNSYERLTPEQKEFIRGKVKELGSAEVAKRHYTNPYQGTRDLVERYASKMIREIYS